MPVRPALQKIRQQICSSLLKTILHKQNNSMLVLGPPGTGKTLAVTQAIAAARAECAEPDGSAAFAVVWLSGLLQNDERRAMKHIARQLCDAFRCTFSASASCGENMAFLRGMLQELCRAQKSVVFVLEDFHLFMRRSKPTAIYNLLDTLQAANMQAAVIGITCQHDVVEHMEKRARSRFSHRKLLVPAPSFSCSDPQDQPASVLRSMLLIGDATSFDLGRAATAELVAASRQWDASVDAALRDSEVRKRLDGFALLGASCQQLASVSLDVCERAMSGCAGGPGNAQRVVASDVAAALDSACNADDSMPQLLGGLSYLQLQLLVAAQRLALRGATDVNFQAVWEEHKSSSGSGLRFEEAAAWAAFQGLLSLAVLVHADRHCTAKAPAKMWAVRLAVTGDEIRRGVQLSGTGVQSLMELLTAPGVGMRAAEAVA